MQMKIIVNMFFNRCPASYIWASQMTTANVTLIMLLVIRRLGSEWIVGKDKCFCVKQQTVANNQLSDGNINVEAIFSILDGNVITGDAKMFWHWAIWITNGSTIYNFDLKYDGIECVFNGDRLEKLILAHVHHRKLWQSPVFSHRFDVEKMVNYFVFHSQKFQ